MKPIRRPEFRLALLLAFALPFLAATTSRAAELPERCRLLPVNGECKAMMTKARYDAVKGRCVEYFYDGCGPVVPFETLEACRELCETAGGVDNSTKAPPPKRASGLAYDPVEDDPRYAEAFRTIDDEVKAEMARLGNVQQRGSVHRYWATKKGLLKRKHGIDWRDPGEMNPHVIFD